MEGVTMTLLKGNNHPGFALRTLPLIDPQRAAAPCCLMQKARPAW
jgi:hypothetical protein